MATGAEVVGPWNVVEPNARRTGPRSVRGTRERRSDVDRPGGVGIVNGSPRLTNVSWLAPDAMSFELWVLDGRRLGTIGRGVGWWIGDWLRFGNSRYGEKYVRAAKITGFDIQTLMNMVYVASSIEPSRRREKLSWSHHAEVAALPPDEQRIWLDRAEDSRLSVHDLRQLLRAARRLEQAEAADGEQDVTPAPHTICPECGHTFPVRDRRRRDSTQRVTRDAV